MTRQNPHGGYLLKKKMKAVKSLEKRYEREGFRQDGDPGNRGCHIFKLGEAVKMPAGKIVLEFSLDRLLTPVSGKRNRVFWRNMYFCG